MRRPGTVLAFAVLNLAAGCQPTGESPQNTEVELMIERKSDITAGAGQEVEIAGGEHHVWTWKLGAGEFARLEVEQLGIDVVVRLLPPGSDDAELEADGLNGEWGTERLSAIAGADATYRVEIVPGSRAATPGRYRITASEQRAATDVDRQNVAAEHGFDGAERLRRKRDEASLRRALDGYRGALATFEETGDEEGRIRALQGLGFVHRHLAQGAEARVVYRQLLGLSQELGRRSEEARSLNRLGGLDLAEGDDGRAEERFRQALAIAEAVSDEPVRAHSLNNLAAVEYRRENLAGALERFDEVQQLWSELGRPRELADAHHNLSQVLRAQGQFREAIDALERVRDLRRQTEDDVGTAAALLQLGDLHRRLGEPQSAREVYQQALAVGSDKLPGELRVLLANNLGLIHAELGEEEPAAEQLEEALAEARRLKLARHEAMAALNLADLHRTANRPREALKLVRRAQGLSERLDDRRHLAACGLVEARALRDLGQLETALARLETAVAQVEELRLDHAGWSFRMAFFATRQSYYDELIDLLVELHKTGGDGVYLERALHASERRRARSLLDALAEGQLRYRGDPALLDREQRLAADLAEVDRELKLPAVADRRAEAADSDVPAVAEQAEQIELERRRRRKLLELETVRTAIRRQSPQYADLTRPEPLSIEAIRTEVLDADTRLLVYNLGDQRSYLWALDRRQPLQLFELPARTEIESAVRNARTALKSRSTDQRERHQRQLGRLADLVLGPLAETLDRRRLAVVADGALQTVPFSALPEPESPRSSREPGTRRPWLIEGREVVHLPSASALAALRREVADRPQPPHDIAVFADPVFSADDPRLGERRAGPAEPELPAGLEQALRNVGSMADLPRLEATHDEARAIARLIDSHRRLMAVSFDASRQTFEEMDLERFKVLHFATHGLLDLVQPELSGLVLSLFDEQGRSVDGFLRAHELYARPLAAELVVLSACQTGLGREVRGEGLVGLPRGFLYAGVPRVVVSLWNVADHRTAELMSMFYEGYADGLSPAAALRQAQLRMIRPSNEQEEATLPFYWAAFSFVGEWRGQEELGRSVDQDDGGGVVINDPGKGSAYDQDDGGGVLINDPGKGRAYPMSGDIFEIPEREAVGTRLPATRSMPPTRREELAHPDDFVNGIDAETGSFLSATADDRGWDAMQLDPRRYRNLQHWVENHHPEDPYRLPMYGVDPEDLAQAGWAVVFGPDVSSEARDALAPLLARRRSQAGGLYQMIDYAGEQALRFLTDRKVPFGPAVPEKLPYYLLLVGNPSELPFDFQYQLDVQYAVGRLHFDQADDYGRYAQAVLAAERADAGGREAIFWGTDIPGDRNSRWMMRGLVEPLIADLGDWRQKQGLYDVEPAHDGTRKTLVGLLGDAPPAFLFTASHGLVFSDGHTRQYDDQGALVCEDFGMRLRGQPLRREHYFSADDLPEGTDLKGLIACHFACYSAGCSQRDSFGAESFGGRRKLAPRSFVSSLSRRLLASGAQAVVGHVDRAWRTSFTWTEEGDQIQVFASMLRQLLAGQRLGHATEWIHYRYAECATQLSRLLGARLRLESVREGLLRRLREVTLDARNYLVIGDPAVRLVGAARRRFQRSDQNIGDGIGDHRRRHE